LCPAENIYHQILTGNNDMNRVLVTGANRGIGLELCRQLSTRGDEVIAVCRQSNTELEALNIRVIEGIDVTDDESAWTLSSRLAGQPLDWLINNAGILSVQSLENLDFDEMQQQFSVNTLGPLRISSALLPNLSAGSKIGIITSRMGSVEDNTSGGYYGYRMSKAAVNMVGMSLSRDLKDRGIAVALLHPGMVATEMTGRQGVSPEHAASGLIARMDELELDTTGTFWHAEGERLPW
jgi:NAD(P)-dependent dehydrogenase (short-subunit alcohol dehydrogenase family)